jgi:hypothetical protein
MERVLMRDTIFCPLPKKRERENINEKKERKRILMNYYK